MSAQPLIEDDDRRDAIRHDLEAARATIFRLNSIMARLPEFLDSSDGEAATTGAIMMEAGQEAVGICWNIIIDSLPALLDIDTREGSLKETDAAFAAHQAQYRAALYSE